MTLSAKVKCDCVDRPACEHEIGNLKWFAWGYASHFHMQNTLAVEFEARDRGSRFPFLQAYDPLAGVDFSYQPKEAPLLQREILGIRNALAGHRYPAIEAFDDVWPRQYDRDLRITSSLGDDPWEVGVDEESRIFVRNRADGIYETGIDFSWNPELPGYAIKPSGALFLDERLLELERFTLFEIDLWEYYSLILEGLLELCRVSQDSGRPILLT